jgi:hypothetical protein
VRHRRSPVARSNASTVVPPPASRTWTVSSGFTTTRPSATTGTVVRPEVDAPALAPVRRVDGERDAVRADVRRPVGERRRGLDRPARVERPPLSPVVPVERVERAVAAPDVHRLVADRGRGADAAVGACQTTAPEFAGGAWQRWSSLPT